MVCLHNLEHAVICPDSFCTRSRLKLSSAKIKKNIIWCKGQLILWKGQQNMTQQTPSMTDEKLIGDMRQPIWRM